MDNEKIHIIEEKIGRALLQFIMTNDEEDVPRIFLEYLGLGDYKQMLRDRLNWGYDVENVDNIIFQVFDVLDASLENVKCDWCDPKLR